MHVFFVNLFNTITSYIQCFFFFLKLLHLESLDGDVICRGLKHHNIAVCFQYPHKGLGKGEFCYLCSFESWGTQLLMLLQWIFLHTWSTIHDLLLYVSIITGCVLAETLYWPCQYRGHLLYFCSFHIEES